MYKLLVADDEKLARETIKLFVSKLKQPILVFEASSGREAVHLYKQERPEFVFLDLKMPGMDGIEASKQIIEYDNNAIISYLTAFDTFEYAKEAIKIGVKDFLVKPVSLEEIEKIISKFINIVIERDMKITERNERIRTVISQFSLSFFTSLKFGKISNDLIVSYFNIAQDKNFQAVSIIVSGQDDLINFTKNPIFNGVSVYYFDSLDRSTYIIFSHDIMKFLNKLKSINWYEDLHIGVGTIVTSVECISDSIRQASIAYTLALEENKTLKEYHLDDEIKLKNMASDELVNNIYESILSLNNVKARQYAHRMFDYYRVKRNIKELHQKIIILEHNLRTNIKYIKLPPCPLVDFDQLLTYLMNMIDICIEAGNIDRVDKWKRAFVFIEEYININYAKNLSIEFMSSLLGLNERYFSKLFKSYYNIKYIDYLTSVRMNNARKLIESDLGVSIAKIAELTGYKDSVYFTKVFQKYYNISPSSYNGKLKKL